MILDFLVVLLVLYISASDKISSIVSMIIYTSRVSVASIFECFWMFPIVFFLIITVWCLW